MGSLCKAMRNREFSRKAEAVLKIVSEVMMSVCAWFRVLKKQTARGEGEIMPGAGRHLQCDSKVR